MRARSIRERMAQDAWALFMRVDTKAVSAALCIWWVIK